MTKSLTYPRDRQSASRPSLLALRTRLRLASAPAFGLGIRTRPSGRPRGCFRTHESGALAYGTQDSRGEAASPAAAIVLVLLFIVCFIIALWVLMALTRIVLG